ncbi:NUDIX hydrolase [Streptomyces sp. NPDC048416]|uniref:NUDIX hydrolase n=1 Tax=Streptomyces sp. NPDC048416 TaxID=3365546 RepID=UPI00371987AB
MSTASDHTVLAAGCVLWRRADRGERADRPDRSDRGEHRELAERALEICLVHRPKYDDWSHPKGKLKRGEAALAGALREVLEETGFACVPGPRLPTAHYTDPQGRPKRVAYWAAEAGEGHFTPNAEVDRLLWLPPAAAHDRLTRPRDRQLLLSMLDGLAPHPA